MICENCGAKIRKGEGHCPKCGMELFNSEDKPLQKKFLRGEYRDAEEVPVAPYDLEETYQNWEDYDPELAHEDDDNKGYDKDYNQNQGYNGDGNQDQKYNQNYNNDQKLKQGYEGNKPYKKKSYPYKNYDENSNPDDQGYSDVQGHKSKYNQGKGSKGGYNKKRYPKKKRQRAQIYNLDEHESEPKKNSIWGTVILFLVLAMLIGFVMGFIFFSSRIQKLF